MDECFPCLLRLCQGILFILRKQFHQFFIVSIKNISLYFYFIYSAFHEHIVEVALYTFLKLWRKNSFPGIGWIQLIGKRSIRCEKAKIDKYGKNSGFNWEFHELFLGL